MKKIILLTIFLGLMNGCMLKRATKGHGQGYGSGKPPMAEGRHR
jgi:hypothetical protein